MVYIRRFYGVFGFIMQKREEREEKENKTANDLKKTIQ